MQKRLGTIWTVISGELAHEFIQFLGQEGMVSEDIFVIETKICYHTLASTSAVKRMKIRTLRDVVTVMKRSVMGICNGEENWQGKDEQAADALMPVG